MLRLGAIFILICVVLIAGCFGAVLFLVFGLNEPEATVAAIAALTTLALYNAVTTWLRDRSDFGGQIADLSRGTGDLARQVAEFGRRIATLETRDDGAADKSRTAAGPMSVDMSELGTLVKQLAESVAAHQVAIAAIATGGAPARTAVIAELGEPKKRSAGDAGMQPLGPDEMLANIQSAVDAGRVDLYLQPIVTLPQRKVRYYEAFTRLRTEDGQMLLPADFLGPAETGGLMAKIDNLLLFRCVQVVRRLMLKNRDIGLFCNISASTLNDSELFPQLSQFMEANRALAPSLVLELKQSAWRAMGPIEQESLAWLRELGFRFCMDQVTDLRIEARDIAERGIRFVKVPGTLLLGNAGTGSDIHSTDLADLLGRFGISLIADKIESEAHVVDLLDYDLKFGQGFLFSPPRPVRAEALQGAAERADTPSSNSSATARSALPPASAPNAA